MQRLNDSIRAEIAIENLWCKSRPATEGGVMLAMKQPQQTGVISRILLF